MGELSISDRFEHEVHLFSLGESCVALQPLNRLAVLGSYHPSHADRTNLTATAAATSQEFHYVDYQPTATDERFKLYDEAEVFAVKAC